MEKKFERKNGTGVLFKNSIMKSDKHPEMSGSVVTPDGHEYRIVAWSRLTKKGEKFLSLALSEPVKKENIDSVDLNSNDLPF